MKQLTVYCSRDLEDRVVSTLDALNVEGYVRLGDATGNKFLPGGQVPRTMTWEATIFVVPAATDEQVTGILERLREYAGSCEIEPCLRIVTSPVEQVF